MCISLLDNIKNFFKLLYNSIIIIQLLYIPNYYTDRTKRFERTGYRQMYYRYILERCRKSCHPKLQIIIQNCGHPAGLTFCDTFTFHDDNHIAFYWTYRSGMTDSNLVTLRIARRDRAGSRRCRSVCDVSESKSTHIHIIYFPT